MRPMDRGFTLLEILIVVVIMAIAAVVVPMSLSRNADTMNVPAAARMVIADLNYAQNKAITEQKHVYVFFRTDGAQLTGYDLKIRTEDTANPGTFTYSPVTTSDRGEWSTRFGSYGNTRTAPGALRATTLVRVVLEKVEPTTLVAYEKEENLGGVLGFDAQGRPIINNAETITTLSKFVGITIANSKGDVQTELRIAPATGNISIPTLQ
jgi:prepilin-type N-terminal cleavage/methylation domain-containing protein